MVITENTRSQSRNGAVIEIETLKERTYAHFMHKHSQYGALLRVLHGFYKKVPKTLAGLLGFDPQFEQLITSPIIRHR